MAIDTRFLRLVLLPKALEVHPVLLDRYGLVPYLRQSITGVRALAGRERQAQEQSQDHRVQCCDALHVPHPRERPQRR